MSLLLKMEGVGKSFGSNHVLQGIDLALKGGEIAGLIGRSGCGKSTLLKIIIGFYGQDSGVITLNGKKISSDIQELRRKVGYTTQENSFYEKLTVLENMQYYGRLYGLRERRLKERIDLLLGQVGLDKSKGTIAENISGGQKRRLDFAISLIHDPTILILDEPTTGLDPLLIDQFWTLVKKVVQDEEKIVIMTSHILSEIERYCTKAAIMDRGKIAALLEKDEMKGLEKRFRDIVARGGGVV